MSRRPSLVKCGIGHTLIDRIDDLPLGVRLEVLKRMGLSALCVPWWRKELQDPDHPDAMAELLLIHFRELAFVIACRRGLESVARHMLENRYVVDAAEAGREAVVRLLLNTGVFRRH